MTADQFTRILIIVLSTVLPLSAAIVLDGRRTRQRMQDFLDRLLELERRFNDHTDNHAPHAESRL